ncbi:MAG: hypothetical protein AAF496_13725 [Pseudomonadota bacterium]
MDERLDILQGLVIDFNASLPPPIKGHKTVNVFAIPEYYFAKSRSEHFVDEDTKNTIAVRLQKISQIGPTLLVAGTIPWMKPMNKRRVSRASSRLAKNNERSSVLRAHQESGDWGNVWYAENTAFITYDGRIVHKYHKRNNGGEVNSADLADRDVVWVPGIESGEFKVEGLRFGVEICAEHAGGLMQRVVKRQLDVHIVISAHMAIQPGAHGHAKLLGYLMHADATDPPTVHINASPWAEVGPDTSEMFSPLTNTQILNRLDNQDEYSQASSVPMSESAQMKRLNDTLTVLNGRLNTYQLPYRA